jgi:peptide methionine sulfoxide reductase msrA/msrB
MKKNITGYGNIVAIVIALFAVAIGFSLLRNQTSAEDNNMNYNKLTPEEERVIVHKGTEMPFTGMYYLHKEPGTYVCRRCGAPLYRSEDKFESGCGWPSFDDEIKGAVKRSLDADGHRIEITCANCGAHLGHVFEGEGYTDKNIRHCVNSISLDFIPAGQEPTPAGQTSAASENETARAYFAGGCFWGVEYLLEQQDGVIDARSGYMGGDVENPDYKQVCTGNTGHAETVEVEFDPSVIDFEKLARYFFEIHDPTQRNRQGPDIGQQYRSAVFYTDEHQKQVTEKLIGILKSKGYDVVTEVAPAGTFYPAEDYHQDYYESNGKQPYCHAYQKRF